MPRPRPHTTLSGLSKLRTLVNDLPPRTQAAFRALYLMLQIIALWIGRLSLNAPLEDR